MFVAWRTAGCRRPGSECLLWPKPDPNGGPESLAGAASALKERERDDREDEIARLKSKVGEIALDNELAGRPGSPPWRPEALRPEGGCRDDEPDGSPSALSLLWPGAGHARVECRAPARIASQGNAIACRSPVAPVRQALVRMLTSPITSAGTLEASDFHAAAARTRAPTARLSPGSTVAECANCWSGHGVPRPVIASRRPTGCAGEIGSRRASAAIQAMREARPVSRTPTDPSPERTYVGVAVEHRSRPSEISRAPSIARGAGRGPAWSVTAVNAPSAVIGRLRARPANPSQTLSPASRQQSHRTHRPRARPRAGRPRVTIDVVDRFRQTSTGGLARVPRHPKAIDRPAAPSPTHRAAQRCLAEP